jgi:hypothetical protein
LPTDCGVRSLLVVERPGSEFNPSERYLIDAVTDVAHHHLGRDWGKWCERDGRDGSGLRVDVTFEDCGIALESLMATRS